MPHTQWVVSNYERSSAQYEADKTAEGRYKIRRLECDGFPEIPLGTVESEDRAKRFLTFYVKADARIHRTLILVMQGKEASLTDIIIEAAQQC